MLSTGVACWRMTRELIGRHIQAHQGTSAFRPVGRDSRQPRRNPVQRHTICLGHLNTTSPTLFLSVSVGRPHTNPHSADTKTEGLLCAAVEALTRLDMNGAKARKRRLGR